MLPYGLVWDLPDGEKSLRICLPVSAEYTNVRDRQTDTPADTVWRHRPRLWIASASKNILR